MSRNILEKEYFFKKYRLSKALRVGKEFGDVLICLQDKLILEGMCFSEEAHSKQEERRRGNGTVAS